ncbi:TPA_asm: P0 protein [Cardamom polerovirus]|uniref:P0 protein n=1 Tax=Cardamom polerovirus TaxID=2754871 RepID=A0AAD2QFV7_9VIRU|nr:TPA_asm: P0 protein [Cardamom polerovirus]
MSVRIVGPGFIVIKRFVPIDFVTGAQFLLRLLPIIGDFLIRNNGNNYAALCVKRSFLFVLPFLLCPYVTFNKFGHIELPQSHALASAKWCKAVGFTPRYWISNITVLSMSELSDTESYRILIQRLMSGCLAKTLDGSDVRPYRSFRWFQQYVGTYTRDIREFDISYNRENVMAICDRLVRRALGFSLGRLGNVLILYSSDAPALIALLLDQITLPGSSMDIWKFTFADYVYSHEDYLSGSQIQNLFSQ